MRHASCFLGLSGAFLGILVFGSLHFPILWIGVLGLALAGIHEISAMCTTVWHILTNPRGLGSPPKARKTSQTAYFKTR